MKSINSKKTALIGNALTTILVAFMGTINIINHLYSFTGYSPFVIALVGDSCNVSLSCIRMACI